jgi:hypothetical protein
MGRKQVRTYAHYLANSDNLFSFLFLKNILRRPLIVAIARLDQISSTALKDWREYYAMNAAHPTRPDAKVYFVDGKLG